VKKRSYRLHYIIQSALIVLAVTALLLLRRQIIMAGEARSAVVFTDIVVLVFVICSGILLMINLLSARERVAAPRSDDDDLIRLQHQASIDALTELLNREEATERIVNYLNTDGQHGKHTLFIIDLDSFKSVNDTFGHFEGDRVLKILAAKLRSAFRANDIVGRLGGDEFLVLMKNSSAAGAVQKKSRRAPVVAGVYDERGRPVRYGDRQHRYLRVQRGRKGL
jgi:GGDEF domain-containing protein